MPVGTQLYIYQQRSAEEFGKPFPDALPEIFAQVRAAGYDGVELPLALCGTPDDAARVGDLLAQSGLQLASVYAGGAVHDARANETMWAVLDQVAEAKLLGARDLTFNPEPLRDHAKTDQELRTQAATLDLLGAQLQGRGARLALHFHAPELRDGGRELWADFDLTTRANVGLCLDVDWAWRGGVDPMLILDKYGDRLVSLHIRDAAHGLWAQALGDGQYDYAPIVRRLRELAFDGWVNVELAYEPGMIWNRSVAENLRRSRDWLREVFGV